MSTFSKPSLATKTALGLAALAGAASAYSTSEHARLQSTLDVLKANPGAAGGAVRFKLNGRHDAARNATERGSLVGALSAAASCDGPGARVFRDVGGKHERETIACEVRDAAGNLLGETTATDARYAAGHWGTWNYLDDSGAHYWKDLFVKETPSSGAAAAKPPARRLRGAE